MWSRLSLIFITMVLEDLKLIGLDAVVADMDEETAEEDMDIDSEDDEDEEDEDLGEGEDGSAEDTY